MNDPEIRKIALDSILNKYSTAATLTLEEVGILFGESIVDIAVFSSTMNHAFEIKSAVDSLTRLNDQMRKYSMVFDYITIITQPSHYDKIELYAPKYVGIILVYDDGVIEKKRSPIANPLIQNSKLIQILWKEELYSYLKSNGHKGLSKLTKSKLRKYFLENYDGPEIKKIIFETLKKRVGWKTSSYSLGE